MLTMMQILGCFKLYILFIRMFVLKCYSIRDRCFIFISSLSFCCDALLLVSRQITVRDMEPKGQIQVALSKL